MTTEPASVVPSASSTGYIPFDSEPREAVGRLELGPEMTLWRERHMAAFLELCQTRFPAFVQDWQLQRVRQG